MWKPLSFTKALAINTITFVGERIKVDDFIAFKLNNADCWYYGRIHTIDLACAYPLELEWYTGVNEKRLSRFSPDDIEYIQVEESLNAARDYAG